MNALFNLGKSGTPKNDNARQEPSAVRGLPSSWYRSEAMHQLERRAVFSKRWLLVSHKLRFAQAGDYLRLTMAGFPIFLEPSTSSSGNAAALACRYHGWSYGFDGRLAKAPRYEELPSFAKSENDLFGIHVHVDKLGFVWVNLESAETPSVPWSSTFAGVDEQERLSAFDTSRYRFDHEWELPGAYDWKTLAENYNECYHCPTGHPAVNGVTNLSRYWVETAGSHIQHFNVDKDDGTKGLGIYSTFFYPNASATLSPDFFYLMRCVPEGPGRARMQYEVYRHEDATDEAFRYITEFFKQVLREDKDLCVAAQKNFDVGVFTSGELHPRVEKGTLFTQHLTRQLVVPHRQEEERQEREIWPATPKPSASQTLGINEDLEFCAKLDCAHDNAQLAW
ncbi:hypothetical protein N3K66_000838 [Trichothecium roseum]|uniref:Uncharacterized protein n=1 Tax=Trichothecium roseum TaxID=47278 RepID=A0ACC0VDD1_9HYPO|nr:hypothetical protein N3K66_000838 [Trichothecium roseum]